VHKILRVKLSLPGKNEFVYRRPLGIQHSIKKATKLKGMQIVDLAEKIWKFYRTFLCARNKKGIGIFLMRNI